MQYYLSVSHTDMAARRSRWRDPERRAQQPTVKQLGVDQADTDFPGGLVALVGEDGEIAKSIPLWGVEGLLPLDGRLLAACPWGISSLDLELTGSTPYLTAPWCNYLHSMRRTEGGGFVVASTGVDMLAEVTDPDAEPSWQWWATENGYPDSAIGTPRELDRGADHRGLNYDTKLHTTHVNSVLPLDEDRVLATFFHQGALMCIDRSTGKAVPLLEDLRRPHAVRRLDDRHLTLADTGRGQALVVRLGPELQAEVVSRVDAETTWLQDAWFDGERWLLVDGANSRVVHADAAGRTLRVDQFDPDWRLYEAVPVAG
ncbi:hypothetical protein [Streptomyces sp. NPDC060031]|uniref:hypothetical protein n=1 Tax=Streptomyces sp. NPDC060031 TaxID=3347043 RepID=UPI0036A9169F